MEVIFPIEEERIKRELRSFAAGPFGISRKGISKITVYDGDRTAEVEKGIQWFVRRSKVVPILTVDSEANILASEIPYVDHLRRKQHPYLIVGNALADVVVIRIRSPLKIPEAIRQAISGAKVLIGSGISGDAEKLEAFGIKPGALLVESGVFARRLYESESYRNLFEEKPRGVFRNCYGERRMSGCPGLGRQGFILAGYDYKVKLGRSEFEKRYGRQESWPSYKSYRCMYNWQERLKPFQIAYCLSDAVTPMMAIWLYALHFQKQQLQEVESLGNLGDFFIELAKQARFESSDHDAPRSSLDCTARPADYDDPSPGREQEEDGPEMFWPGKGEKVTDPVVQNAPRSSIDCNAGAADANKWGEDESGDNLEELQFNLSPASRQMNVAYQLSPEKRFSTRFLDRFSIPEQHRRFVPKSYGDKDLFSRRDLARWIRKAGLREEAKLNKRTPGTKEHRAEQGRKIVQSLLKAERRRAQGQGDHRAESHRLRSHRVQSHRVQNHEEHCREQGHRVQNHKEKGHIEQERFWRTSKRRGW